MEIANTFRRVDRSMEVISPIHLVAFLFYLQIIWYPLLGQLYVLANHLRIDRSNLAAAKESMKEVCIN